MGKFRNIAENIARVASDGGITVNQLSEIIPSTGQSIAGGKINCYPGLPEDQCHPFALFVSLHGTLRRGKWPNFSEILQALIQHFQGKCRGTTRAGVLITDTWESRTYEKWASNIEAIKVDGVDLEIYMIVTGTTGLGWVIEISC